MHVNTLRMHQAAKFSQGQAKSSQGQANPDVAKDSSLRRGNAAASPSQLKDSQTSLGQSRAAHAKPARAKSDQTKVRTHTISSTTVSSASSQLTDEERRNRIASIEASGARRRQEVEARKAQHKRRRNMRIIAGVVVVILIAYFVGFGYFTKHLMPNTFLGETDLSGQSPEVAESMLDEYYESYTLEISGKGVSETLHGPYISYSGSANSVADSQMRIIWPVSMWLRHDIQATGDATYDTDIVTQWVGNVVTAHNENATSSKTNLLVYNSETDKVEFVPYVLGNELVTEKVYAEICAALDKGEATVELSDATVVEPQGVLDDKQKIAAAETTANRLCDAEVKFTLNDSTSFVVDKQYYSLWAVIKDDYSVVLDETLMESWVDGVISCLNSVGGKRTYTRPDGKVCTVSGGTYGWKCKDSAGAKELILNALKTKSTSTTNIACSTTGKGFFGLPGADWGKRYCDVDISEQYARFYDESGELVWETDIVTGFDNGVYDTPCGVYVINSKQSPAALRSYGYVTVTHEDGTTEKVKKQYGRDVQYWMPFITNFIGLHDAWWQDAFGGELYHTAAYGSGGCVNLPSDKAAELYNLIVVGDVVVTHF